MKNESMFFKRVIENIVGKGKNAGYTSTFSFSHNVIKSFLKVLKSRDGVFNG